MHKFCNTLVNVTVKVHGRRNRCGPGGTFTLRAPVIPLLGGTRGDPIYNENRLFFVLLDCFSATAIVV